MTAVCKHFTCFISWGAQQHSGKLNTIFLFQRGKTDL